MSPGLRKAIAVVEVCGGVLGILGVTADLVSGRSSPGVLAFVAAASLLSAAAGFGLWRDTRSGRVATALVQALQLPKVMSSTVAYMMSFGVDVAPMIYARPDRSGLTIDFRLGPSQLLGVNNPGLPDAFGVSLVSCVVLWMLWPRRPTPAEPPVVEESADPLVRLCRATKMDGPPPPRGQPR